MPRLARLYIVSVAIGFAMAVLFVAALLALDVGGLRRLVLASPSGWLGGAMLVFFNGIVFAGVQFGFAVMALARAEDGPTGGRRRPGRGWWPLPLPAMAPAGRARAALRNDTVPSGRRR
jgi:hypothetical protein